MVPSAEHIERLETQIEELQASIRQSRKLMLAGQMSAVLGLLGLVLVAVYGVFLNLAWLVMAVALALGGLVLSGSSQRTTDDLRQALMKAQMSRTEAIDALTLLDVSETEAKITPPETG